MFMFSGIAVDLVFSTVTGKELGQWKNLQNIEESDGLLDFIYGVSKDMAPTQGGTNLIAIFSADVEQEAKEACKEAVRDTLAPIWEAYEETLDTAITTVLDVMMEPLYPVVETLALTGAPVPQTDEIVEQIQGLLVNAIKQIVEDKQKS